VYAAIAHRVTEATEVATAVLSTSTPGDAFYGYGSVVDNETADPTFIAIQ